VEDKLDTDMDAFEFVDHKQETAADILSAEYIPVEERRLLVISLA
jgi:hypothetical protein